MSNFLREVTENNKTRKGLTLGLVSASLFATGCGGEKTSGQSQKAENAAGAAVTKKQHSTGPAMLDGCDPVKEKKVLEARMKDGKPFGAYIINSGDKFIAVQEVTKRGDVVLFPIITACEKNGRKEYGTSVDINYPVGLVEKNGKQSGLGVVGSGATKVLAVSQLGKPLNDTQAAKFKPEKVELHYNNDFGKRLGKASLKGFVDSQGIPHGIGQHAEQPDPQLISNINENAYIIDVTKVLNK